jgi:hypothetical protein
MPRYYYEHSYHRQTRFIKRVKKLLLLAFVLIAVTGAYLAFDAWRQQRQSTKPTAPTEKTTSIYAPKTQFFSTQYFQFEASNDWAHMANESTGNKYVYRKAQRNIVSQNLTIIVNDPKPVPEVTRVLPVDIGPTGILQPGSVSDACSKYLPKTAPKISQIVSVEGVEFLCDYDASDYYVVVGAKGTSPPLVLKRSSGETAKYTILYMNVTATPEGEEIKRMMSTFQAR